MTGTLLLTDMNFLTVFHSLRKKVVVLYDQLKLNFLEQATGRPRSLSILDALTLGLYWKTQDVTTKKALWRDFAPPCTYKTLVVTLNRFALVALLILKKIMASSREWTHTVKHTDSTDISVCLAKNAKRHKTMNLCSQWGYSGKGWFYGLKLHATTDLNGLLLNVSFTPANGSEREQFLILNKDLAGLFVADAGYGSQKLSDAFNKEGERIVFAKPYKTMRVCSPIAVSVVV